MGILAGLKPKKTVKALLRADFYIHHQKGSHIHLRHKTKHYLRVTVPYHTKFELPVFVIRSILKQAELSIEDFQKLL